MLRIWQTRAHFHQTQEVNIIN